MLYVTDTHSLLWFLSNDPQLSKKAESIFTRAETGEHIIVIPSIVLAEALHILEQKHVRTKFQDLLNIIKVASNYEVFPLDLAILEHTFQITTLRELHDRIIVATAHLLRATLITRDKAIRESKEVSCIW